jgi:uncharacterized LabA/DUF88 family protein
MKTFVYIDGFNLYYGIRNTPFKWLNPKLLAEKILPSDYKVERVKYYTARVSGAVDVDQPRRQQIYLNALRTIPEIEIFFGNFVAKNVLRPLTNLPISNRRILLNPAVTLPAGQHSVEFNAGPPPKIVVMPVGKPRRGGRQRLTKPPVDFLLTEVYWMEEKGSDVNLACHLVNDAWQNVFDVAVVISNDTDLCEPVRIVAQERKKQVVVVCPNHEGTMAAGLERVATAARHINKNVLKASQFPVVIPGTGLAKPAQW